MRYKWAIEILGNILNTITGVPSAGEHRAVLEKIRLLRLDNENVNNMLQRQNAQNAGTLRTFHLHESDIEELKAGMNKINSQWLDLTT